MDEFAERTGLSGHASPRRYLWTDAFAVCNFVGLSRATGDDRYLKFALQLIDQVHHVLGRHRPDDPRQGWISGLSDDEGERHPTRGGLRIGKKLNERAPDQLPDARLEWEQDGQYFHYLTKWMHALYRASQETEDARYYRWAAELASVAHQAFTFSDSLGRNQMVWKMSIDLSRPLVNSMGHHDPLDGLITFLELQTAEGFVTQADIDLTSAIMDMTEMCAQGRWATEDPLGIGGLLDDAVRVAQMVVVHGVEVRDLLIRLLREIESSLRAFAGMSPLRYSADQRLAFRELGLSIGVHGLDWIAGLVSRDADAAALIRDLLAYRSLAEQIEEFWSQPLHRENHSWMDHCDINTVMLATSLAPDSYLKI